MSDVAFVLGFSVGGPLFLYRVLRDYHVPKERARLIALAFGMFLLFLMIVLVREPSKEADAYGRTVDSLEEDLGSDFGYVDVTSLGAIALVTAPTIFHVPLTPLPPPTKLRGCPQGCPLRHRAAVSTPQGPFSTLC